MKYVKIATLILLGIATMLAATTASDAKASLLKPVISIEGKIILNNADVSTKSSIYVLNQNNKKIGKFSVNQLDKSFYITGLKPNTKYFLVFEINNLITDKMEIVTPKNDEFQEIQQNFKIDAFTNEIETAKK